MSLSTILSELAPRKRVLVIGAAFVDVVIGLERLPRSGEDVSAEYRGAIVGGCGFNVADVLHKLGLPFDLFLPVGGGPYGKPVREVMERNGYPVHTVVDGEDNGWCMSLVEAGGERSFITVPGLETRMREEWFAPFDIASYDYFYISGYEAEGANGEVLLRVLGRKRPDAVIVFDPGPRAEYLTPAFLKDLYGLNVMLTLNETETLRLGGGASLDAAAINLFRATGQPVVVTRGGLGACVATDTVTSVPGFAATVVDTIGAGDSHTGGILAGLLCGRPLEEAVLLANKIASVVVGRSGAATAPTLAELSAGC